MNGGAGNDVAATSGVKSYVKIMTEISILLQGEGFNCETNETSGDGSWSNVAAQKDWILDQLVPERRAGFVFARFDHFDRTLHPSNVKDGDTTKMMIN